MRNLTTIYPVLAWAALICGPVIAGSSFGDWQREKLLQPTARDLAREDAGKVYIFDGMKDADIELAMQTQFERVANMMFVRTIVTDELDAPLRDEVTGDYVVEDDGCD